MNTGIFNVPSFPEETPAVPAAVVFSVFACEDTKLGRLERDVPHIVNSCNEPLLLLLELVL